MNKYKSNFLYFRHIVSAFVGLFLVVCGGFYFFNVSAQTETTEKQPPEQNLVNGKLVFRRTADGLSGITDALMTANPDGSGQTTILSFARLSEPVWSPDGNKFTFAAFQTPFQYDIYSINADGSGLTNLTNTADPIQERNPSWSVAGKIAYERSPTQFADQIWVMNTDGSGQARFSGITQPVPTAPAWSPNGTKLAFLSNGEIWVINADGTNERRVTNNTTTDTDPSWSPDSTKIAFGKLVEGAGNGIGVINADGTNEMSLVSIGNQPSWSPDGTKIAFRGSQGVYTMNADGTGQAKIVDDFIVNFPLCCTLRMEAPAWQPVVQTPNTFVISGRVTYNNLPVIGATVNLIGTTNAAVLTDAVGNYQFSGLPTVGEYTVSPSLTRYYFTPANRFFNSLNSNQTADFEALEVCQGGNCVKNGKIAYVSNDEIYTINPDGTNETNITNNASIDGEPNYSPNGSSIVFSTNRDGNFEIYRMTGNGGNLVRLTNNSTEDSLPYYSPEGLSIVFVSNRDGNNEIYKMNADGSNQVRLTNDSASDSSPAVSPNGLKIIFISSRSGNGNEKIFSMNSDGSNQQVLSDAPTISPCYNRLDYSPDGSKIIFGFSPDCGTTHPSVWSMNSNGSNRVSSGFGRYANYSPDGLNTASVCCYFDPFNSPPRMSIFSVNGGSGRTLPRVFTMFDKVYPDWQPLPSPRRTAFDYDGDGRSDISVFRPSSGIWYQLRSTTGFAAPQWGISTDVLTPADYDGDLKTDVAVWRPSEGNFYILNSFNNTVRIENFGLSGDVPTGGDWDGDSKADVAVYRGGTTGVFYYRGSTGNSQSNISSVPWGISGDKPVAGDYDGDVRMDAAIYRNGIWYIRQSSNGQLSAVSFGQANDVIVPADYDADGKTDQAVYRNGIWYLLRSTQGFTAFQFGISNDIPAPGDYDGDGRADAAIFRNGVWWILKTQSGTVEAVSFGLSGDKPIPSAFVR